MSAAFGPERPIISAEEAERWAESEGLRFPELVADEAPEWVWHDGGEGFYVGYVPADWDGPVEDVSYEMLEVGDGEELHGRFEQFFDLGVCTVVVRGDRNALWQDEPFAIPVLGADELHEWQRADGWFDDEVEEVEEFFGSVFEAFEEFEQEMRSKQLGLPDDGSDLVARATGWAERRGPYCEWELELRAMGDGRFLALGGPPGRVRVWKFRREFERLEVAARWMHSAAESLGTMADASSAWLERWPE